MNSVTRHVASDALFDILTHSQQNMEKNIHPPIKLMPLIGVRRETGKYIATWLNKSPGTKSDARTLAEHTPQLSYISV